MKTQFLNSTFPVSHPRSFWIGGGNPPGGLYDWQQCRGQWRTCPGCLSQWRGRRLKTTPVCAPLHPSLPPSLSAASRGASVLGCFLLWHLSLSATPWLSQRSRWNDQIMISCFWHQSWASGGLWWKSAPLLWPYISTPDGAGERPLLLLIKTPEKQN